MALSDDDSETVDASSGSEEDGLDTTEAGRELMVYPAVSDVLGVEDIMTEEEALHEDEGTMVLLTPELDGFKEMSPLQLAWSTKHESERTQSPLVCEPLAKIAPMGFSEFTINTPGMFLPWKRRCLCGLKKNIGILVS